MDIIPYLLSLIQSLYQQNCWLINFICRYIPIRQWAFDDSHSPKYQKFKIDELPLITDFRQDWTYKELIPYYEKRYGRKIRPVSRRSECDMSRAGTPTDNAAMESINGWIKSELFTDFHLQGENVPEEMEAYIKFFNEERPAYALGYLTPKQYRETYATVQ